MENLDKLKRLSTVLRLACTLYLVAAPAALAALWLNLERFGPHVEALRSLSIQLEFLGPLNLGLAFLLSFLLVSLLMA